MKVLPVLMCLTALALPSCTTPRFIFANNQQPIPATAPVVKYALIGNDDTGLVVSTMDTSALPAGEMNFVRMSPDTRLTAMQYVELTTVIEAIVVIYETGSGAPLFSFTDNNIITELEMFCTSTPNFVATQAAVDADIAAGNFPPTTVVEIVFYGSPPSNSVTFEGWTGDDSFRAVASVVTGFEISDSATGTVIVPASAISLEDMTLHFEQSTTGFEVTQCDGALPAIISPSPVRDLEISTSGELLINGAVMEDAAAPGTPLATDPVEALSGPWPL